MATYMRYFSSCAPLDFTIESIYWLISASDERHANDFVLPLSTFSHFSRARSRPAKATHRFSFSQSLRLALLVTTSISYTISLMLISLLVGRHFYGHIYLFSRRRSLRDNTAPFKTTQFH